MLGGEEARMTPFPKIRYSKRITRVRAFCSCGRSYMETADRRSHTCCKGQEWYQQKCEQIPEGVFHESNKKWFSRHCKD